MKKRKTYEQILKSEGRTKKGLDTTLITLSNDDIFKYYMPYTLYWEKMQFVKNGLKYSEKYRFPLLLARKGWNAKKERMREIQQKGLQAFLNSRNKLFAIYDLEIIYGVIHGIYDNNYEDNNRFKNVSSSFVKEKINKTNNHLKAEYINYLLEKQVQVLPVVFINETVIHSNAYSKIRSSFLFSIKCKSGGCAMILESLDFNTATHVFFSNDLAKQEYYLEKARLKNYFQSKIVNKRDKLYNKESFDSHNLNIIRSIYHSTYSEWKKKINSIIF